MPVSNFFKSVQKIWNRQTLADGTLFDEEFGNLYSNFDRIVDKGDLPVHNSSPGSSSVVHVTNQATGQADTDGLRIEVGPSGEAVINQQENQSLVIKTNNSESVVIGADGAVKVDTISERTLNNGVNIEGVNLKDGVISSCPELKVDTINEMTPDNGVNIEGVNIKDGVISSCPAGTILPFSGITLPASFLLADGSALSKTAYSRLFNSITLLKGTVTITIASPGILTLSSHGFQTGDCISLSSAGSLPGGLSSNTNYYAIYNDANSFWLATTLANAIAGTKINTSGSQSGTHSLLYNPWGISGANNFLLPDLRGIGLEGSGQQGIAAWASANYKGRLGQYKQDQMQGHKHTALTQANPTGYNGADRYCGQPGDLTSVPVSDGTNGTPRYGLITAPARVGMNFIIKY